MATKEVQVVLRDSVALEDKTKNSLATSINLQKFLHNRQLTCEDANAFTALPQEDQSEKMVTLIRRWFNRFAI